MKRMFALVLSIAMTMSLVACGGGEKPAASDTADGNKAPDKVYEWKIASIYADPSTNSEFNSNGVAQQYFCDLVNERSGGRIVVTPFFGSVLGANNELYEQCRDGELEVFCGQPNSNYDPRFGAWSLPYLFQSREEVIDVACNPDGAVFKMSQEWLREQNQELIGVGLANMRGIVNNKREIKTVDDVRGLSIRTTQDTIVTAFWSGLCSANPLAMSEVYTSLQTGAIDGLEFSGGSAISQKFYEVANHYSDIDWQWNSGFNLTVSHKAWNELPDDLKEIVRECGIEAAAYQTQLVLDETPVVKEILESHGVTYHEITDEERQTFIDYAQSVYPELREFVGAETFDAMFKAVEDYRATK